MVIGQGNTHNEALSDAQSALRFHAETFGVKEPQPQTLDAEGKTAYLLGNDTMRKRLLKAKNRHKGISLKNARAQLGI